MPEFCNPVGGGDRKEGVLFMSLLLSHDVYNMRIRRISTHSYKLSAESLFKMAVYNMGIINIKNNSRALILFLCWFFVCVCFFGQFYSNEHLKNLL